jgi:trans-aconitate methyltransferase
MDPKELGRRYSKIAEWWHENHHNSDYGIVPLQRAIIYCPQKTTALDVGCGSGGRMINELLSEGYKVTGLDVSSSMIDLARQLHPEVEFINSDICVWKPELKFDLIVAWDSLFHIPFNLHTYVIPNLCGMLKKGGIIMYSFGDDVGEHESAWHNDVFYYSSVGINENLKILSNSMCKCLHLELDQYPEKHGYVIAQKLI